MRAFTLSITLLLMVSADAAHGSGFLLMNQGTGSTGKANAFAATADDGSAIYHNPAGITQIPGYTWYIGVNAIAPEGEFKPEGGGDSVTTDTGVVPAPFGYFTARLSDLITVGLGVNPPYGLGIEWPAESPGRDIVREQQLQSWFITPVVAADLTSVGVKGLSVALGIDLAPASVYLRRDLLLGEKIGQVEISGDDFGVGGRVGFLYKPPMVEGLSVGLMYRLPIAYEFEGDADFDVDDPSLRTLLPPDGVGTASLDVPAVFTLGVGYRLPFGVQAEVNMNYVGWSTYDEVPITLPNGDMSISERDWESQFVFRLGLEYGPGPWSVRAGYAYDPTPIPDETLDFTLPDVDRHVLATGFGYDLPHNLHVDIAAWLLIPNSHTTGSEPLRPREKGTYEVRAWVASLGLGWTL